MTLIRENIRSAKLLYDQAKKSGLDYGCVEVSLQALGGKETHFLDLLEGNSTESSELLDIIYRKGLVPNWCIGLSAGVTGREIREHLDNKVDLPKSPFAGKIAGYLGLIDHPLNDTGHVIAILPRPDLPRNLRRTFKEEDVFMVFDTSAGGLLQISSEGLAQYANSVINLGGEFDIAQLRYPAVSMKHSARLARTRGLQT